jgi:hypothetical protein
MLCLRLRLMVVAANPPRSKLPRACATSTAAAALRIFGMPNPLAPRVTADDRNVHRAFVQTLGTDAIWLD